MYYLIYKITNTINNKIYIGKHQTDNKDDEYMGSGKILKRAIKKYGIDKFKKEILFECNSLEEMNEKEAEIVDAEFVARLDTYNVKLGGQGGFDYINLNNLQRFNKNNKPSEEYLKALSQLGNKKLNELRKDNEYFNELKEKISNGLKLYYSTHINIWFGKKHSEESKAKIGKANSISQKGERNSQYGKCWIYNDELKENKSIKKEDLDYWLQNGWKKGRKMKFKLKGL